MERENELKKLSNDELIKLVIELEEDIEEYKDLLKDANEQAELNLDN